MPLFFCLYLCRVKFFLMAIPLGELLNGIDKGLVKRAFKYAGEDVEFYSSFLTLKQRDAVQASQRKEEDANEFALKLLISKAKTKAGKAMFQPGQYAELKNEWPIAALEAAMLLLLKDKTGEEEGDSEEDAKN